MNKLLVIDIETTGFSHDKCSIVEVGMVELDLSNGDTRIVLDTVCKEVREIDLNSWIFSNSSLTPAMIGSAPTFSRVEKAIQGIIDSYPLGATAFNRDFDMKYLESREIVFKKLQPCPMKVATSICKIPRRGGGYKWPKVEEAWRHFFNGVAYNELHRGADDALHEAHIVYAMFKRGFYKVDGYVNHEPIIDGGF